MDQPKILIVDDEQSAVRNLQHILSKEGCEVIATQSGQNALKLLKQHAFDLVLTDLRMPNVDGMEILRRIKQVSPDTEVIMITGYATVSSAVSAMKTGACHYVIKPYKLDEVREALEKLRPAAPSAPCSPGAAAASPEPRAPRPACRA